MSISVFIHCPIHYEYLCGLGNALEKEEILDVICFSTEDYCYREFVNFDLVDQYTDSKRYRTKFAKLLPHLRASASFIGKMISRRPNILHVQGFRHPAMDWPMLILAKLVGTRTIVTVHNFLPHESKRFDWLIYRLIYWLADHLIAHTEHTARKLAELTGISWEKLSIIPHGTLEFQHHPHIDKDAAREQLEIPEEKTVVLSFGRIRHYKGVDLLIEAVKRLDDPHLLLLIAGNDSMHLKASLTEADPIVFHDGFVDPGRVRLYFAAADLVALPYRKIDQSGVLLLALSSGCPVLATRVGGIKEVIEDGINGFLCGPNDVDALTERLADALASPSELRRIGENGRRTANETFGWESIARQTASLYQDLVKAR